MGAGARDVEDQHSTAVLTQNVRLYERVGTENGDDEAGVHQTWTFRIPA